MKKTRWWALLVLVLAAIWMSPLAALAQQTGGSFGGSRWGSGSSGSRPSSSGSSWSRPSSSGSSWSRPSSGTSYGGGSYGGSSYGGSSYGSRTGGGGGLGGLCCIAFFVLVIVVIVVIAQKKSGGGRAMAPYYPPAGGPMPMPPGGMDTFAVGVLAIAFDSRARAQIQGGIAQIAERSNMGGNGLPNAARETAQLLSQYLDAAYMTQHALSEGITMQTAQQYFDAAVSDARGRFIVETMRNDAGGVRKVEGPRVTARAEEGGGFVVVTIVVGRRGGFFGFQPPTSRPLLAQDLQTILQGDANLNAMEVIWQPSDPNDVMSSAEMAQVFKELRPIDPDQRVPRRACAYCKSVYAAELHACPNCGAPANG